MHVELRTATDADVVAMLRLDGASFGMHWSDEQFAAIRPILDLDRFRLAIADGEVVGIAGSYGFGTTVPGGATLPTGGVTWVSVQVTHRRRGLLGRLMAAVHDDIDDRGEPLASLTASEGGIYERFGYGIATRTRRVVIDRRRARLRDEFAAPMGGVRLVHGDELVPAIVERWERGRVRRPGEISRSEAWQRRLVSRRNPSSTYAVHPDGYAVWTMTEHWNHGHPAHELEVDELIAATPDAHLALWQTILAVDLVGPIVTYDLPFDDPLPYLLVDPRCVRTVEVNDGVWINVRDVPAAFSARTYGTDDDIVIEADGARWRIGGAGCARVRTRPDLVGDHAALGALVLGGTRPSALVAGRRMQARNPEAVRRADALFATSPEPYNQTGF